MGTNVNTEVSKKQTPKQFKTFSWLPVSSQTADIRALLLAKDITAGVKLSLELLERANLDEKEPYLSGFHQGVLTRFAIASCTLLDETIEKRFEAIRDKANGGAK